MVSAGAENSRTSETMQQPEIKRLVAQRLREIFPLAKEWEETIDTKLGGQAADVVVRLRLGEQEKTLVCEVRSLGQPRHIREVVTRLRGFRDQFPALYPMAGSVYISPQSASILRRNGFGYTDLSGNCYVAFDNVLVEKEGKPNVHPTTRPLRTLFAPRATRVVRAILVEPERTWRLEELARAAEVSLGHAHNVIQRLRDLDWVERVETNKIRLAAPGDLLNAWREEYSYRVNSLTSYVAPEPPRRKLMELLARQAETMGRRYAFTLLAGASLIAPHGRLSTIHCYLEGERDRFTQALGLRPAGNGEGNVQLLTPHDTGIFYAPVEKGGLTVVSLPQLYVDLYHFERRGPEQAEFLRNHAMGL